MNDARVVKAHQAAYARTVFAASAAMAALWDQYGGLTDAEAEQFAEMAAEITSAAQTHTVELLDAYLAVLLGGAPIGIDAAVLATVRNGVAAADVYRRSIVAARVAVSGDKSYDQALAIGRARAASAAEMDVALAQRAGMDYAVRTDSRIVGYRRVLTGRSCAFCATASTQRYHSEDLMPLHNHCDCDVAPIIGDRDPGRVINRQLLSDLKDAGGSSYWKNRSVGVDEDGVIRSRREVPVINDDGTPKLGANGRQLRQVELGDPLKIAVRDHGELGPVLTDAADSFTGADDIAA